MVKIDQNSRKWVKNERIVSKMSAKSRNQLTRVASIQKRVVELEKADKNDKKLKNCDFARTIAQLFLKFLTFGFFLA